MSELSWPALPLHEWQDTCQTLHLWTQVAGKVRLVLAPSINHWWQATFYVSTRGLTTSPIPYGAETFEIAFDFIDHRLELLTSTNERASFPLAPQPVATFYERLMAALASLGIRVPINTKPQEVPDPIPFERDFEHAAYDPEYAQRFWRVLVSIDSVFQEFRGRFIGKCSPVHFFWGSFDLACTRFSGRRAPPRKGVITSEAYSHECISAGFWPGVGLGHPAFYSYTAPMPHGMPGDPRTAGLWNDKLSEFILPYDEVRSAPSPRAKLLEFLETTYEVGATHAGWNRRDLERST